MMYGLMLGGDIPEVDDKNKSRAEEYWMYGASADELAKAWDKPVEYAKLKTCANCEYFDNRARILKALNAEPGMGACKKFSFMCSQEASCQAWECKDEDMMEGMEDDD